MSKENEFLLHDWKTFKTELSFEVITWEDNFEATVEISCAEDLEEVMKMYLAKDWKALFYEYNEKHRGWYRDVCDVGFGGLYMVVKEEGKGFVYYRLGTSQKVNVTVDPKQLGDENAEKIKAIRDIIGR